MYQRANSIQQKGHSRPSYPSCARTIEPGASWKGSNHCKAAVLLPVIDSNPGLSTWELSHLCGVLYRDVARGLSKLREHEAVLVEKEDRGDGSYRYRHWPVGDPAVRQRFMEIVRRAEAL